MSKIIKIDGRCHCGEIKYEGELDIGKVGICHCHDCQTLSASVFRTIAVIAGDVFKITKGTPKEYIKVAESGNKRVQAFCGTCGSGIYSADAVDNPSAYAVRAGTIRQRAELEPNFELWLESALPWLPKIGCKNRFAKGFIK